MRKIWNTLDIAYLRENYCPENKELLEERFGVTWHAIKLKAFKSGITTKFISDIVKSAIMRDYATGTSFKTIVESYGIGTTSLYRLLKERGIDTQNKDVPKIEDVAKFKLDYVSLTREELELKYTMSYQNIKLKASDMKVKRPEHLISRPKSVVSKDLLYQEYIVNNLSAEEIAIKYYPDKNCRGHVSSMLQKYNLHKTMSQIKMKAADTLEKRTGFPFPTGCYGKTQQDICDWLQTLGYTFKSDRKVLNGKEIDLYNEELKLGIEYCGLHWHKESVSRPKDYHYAKYQGCLDKGVRLITIFEDEWMLRQEQIKSFITSVLGKNTRKIFARKCTVSTIELSLAKTFISSQHIQAASQLTIQAFGLYLEDELVGIMSYGRHPADLTTIVLDRMVFLPNTTIVGGASKLLKFSLPWLITKGISKVISWSDNRWSQGKVYSKLGFVLAYDGKADYGYVDTKKRYHRVSKISQKKNNTKCPEGMTELEWATARGLYRIWDCGKKRWELDLNNVTV